MGKQLWDLDSGEMLFSLSDNLLMDYNSNLLQRVSDNLAMDYDSGNLHLITSFGSNDNGDFDGASSFSSFGFDGDDD
ncbi:MAG: hypothetical protein LBQ48_00610 [Oscillospiraceae bacterium]|jgi:hypothetical protein|nr:hypothetical protein [Oscillospiraceae bacterium]